MPQLRSHSRRLRLAAAAAIRAAVDACPALSSDLSGGGGEDDADAVAAWACAGGRRAERANRCQSEACSALEGPARRRLGASARRLVGASALLRVDAPAPGASAVCAPLPEWQGRLGRGNRITARQTKAAAVRGQP